MLRQAVESFSASGWEPPGSTAGWNPVWLWSHVISDALITLAYYSIASMLAYLVWHRKELSRNPAVLMLGAFALACGTTHLLSISAPWQPMYWLDAGVQLVTAGISLATVITLLKALPEALRAPGPAQRQAEIAEHRLTGQSLQQSKGQLELMARQLTTLIEAVPDAIYLKDAEGRWQVTNDAAKQLFMLSGIEWQGKTDLELIALQQKLSGVYEMCLDDGEAVRHGCKTILVERQFVDAQGVIREFELRKAPIFTNTGEYIGLAVISRDITARKQYEECMRVADTTFEAQEGIIITDAGNHIQRVNKAFTRLTGYSSDEAIGKTPSFLKSGRHGTEFYRAMWETLLTERFWQGEVWDRRKNGEIYPKWMTITAVSGPEGAITNFVAAFTDLTEHKEAEEAIHRLAFYDPLTDLPNRRLLLDRLNLTLNTNSRNQDYGAVMMVDLDNFKSINDTKGHEVGDQLLIEVAKRLKSCVRQGDTVARLGGDEFVIMLEDLSSNETQAITQAESVAEKIHDAINMPFQQGCHELHSSLSIGICLFTSHDITTDDILKRADTAMYQAKNLGRNTMRFFDPNMQAMLEARMMLESDLRHALIKNQFSLHYQVQVDHVSHIFGVEALLRWEHPQRGLVSPAEFIPLAEETGLILPIGEWVLQTACMQLKAWEHNPATRHLHLAINVSARQFHQPNFVEQVIHALKSSGADATRLKLELTESAIVQDIAETVEKMQELKQSGIHFSMDDFGTGYSSLSYLKKLPLSQLKIDQSFVRDIVIDQSDAVIAQTIIGMAKNLGLTVIAEGVENKEQRACLEHRGCKAFQGYLFGKPLPPQELELLITQSTIAHSI